MPVFASQISKPAALLLALVSPAYADLDLGPDPLPDLVPLNELTEDDVWPSYRAIRCAALYDALDRFDLPPAALGAGGDAASLAESFETAAIQAWRIGAGQPEQEDSFFSSAAPAPIAGGIELMSVSYQVRLSTAFIETGRPVRNGDLVTLDLAHCTAMMGRAPLPAPPAD
ncbi:hypothetical protein AAD018_013035 [Aestuariibius insulae]|uniref:hypothetical protein n=1 Tax=Aestuariibius insulae TaxID=2058287 RepID=UPI00345EEE99